MGSTQHILGNAQARNSTFLASCERTRTRTCVRTNACMHAWSMHARTEARMYARKHARTQASKQAPTHPLTHACTHARMLAWRTHPYSGETDSGHSSQCTGSGLCHIRHRRALAHQLARMHAHTHTRTHACTHARAHARCAGMQISTVAESVAPGNRTHGMAVCVCCNLLVASQLKANKLGLVCARTRAQANRQKRACPSAYCLQRIWL